MGRFDLITKYIELLSNEKYGKWVIDRKNDGSLEHPIHFPYVNYSQIVEDFIQDVHHCWEHSGLNDYLAILKSYGIEWNGSSMEGVDETELPWEALLALLLAAVRAEKFCEGALLSFLKEGYVQRWLIALKERDETKMPKIKIDDLLRISAADIQKVKVKFNQPDGKEDPMELYLSDPEIVNTQWLFWRNTQRYFDVGQIAICLLKLSYDRWLLTTIKRVTEEYDVTDGINYNGEEIEQYRPYFGRVIIKYHKTVQTQRMYYQTVCQDLEVLEILPNAYDGDEFPGYDKVRLSYAQLHNILYRQKQSWMAALENQKAVYLITDKNNGKLYVGSATAEKGMLLARWHDYIENGHGNNVQLKELVKKQGLQYIKDHFQYSILENYNAKVDDSIILERESWWKETLKSKEHGYNKN